MLTTLMLSTFSKKLIYLKKLTKLIKPSSHVNNINITNFNKKS